MAGAADYTAPEDPDEPVIAVTGKHAFPRHPATMKEPYVYKLTFLGPAGAGKTAVASRLVAHNFDPTYRPTLVPQQLFWRHHEEDSGRDILVEIEDVPGIPGRIES
jgi:GTPase SAR1 family protein